MTIKGLTMPTNDQPPAMPGAVLERACSQGRLQRSIATTLCVIAAARAEREAPPIHAARQQLAAVYGATRLRRRLERDAIRG